MISASLNFNPSKDAEINFYVVNVKVYDEPADEVYDWSGDIMSDEWDSAKALKKLKEKPQELLSDRLADQHIFSGSGNIIKNEALFRAKLHPLNKAGDVPDKKLKELITKVRRFSFEFLKAKKSDTLDKHFKVYGKKECPDCKGELKKEHLGKSRRSTYYCEKSQIRYK